MTLLPITPGLLSSAMIRRNHAVFMPGGNDPISRLMGSPEERITSTMDEVLDMYDQARLGRLSDSQMLEEFTGAGFYRTQLEESYIRALDQFHGMLARAMERISRIED